MNATPLGVPGVVVALLVAVTIREPEPPAVGLVSDYLHPIYGAESLRLVLIPLAFVGFSAAWHYWRCAKYLRPGAGSARFPH